MREVKIWEKLLPESTGEYMAFCCYRDKGPERQLTDVMAKLDLAYDIVFSIARKFKWEDRVLAWDRFVVDQIHEKRNSDITSRRLSILKICDDYISIFHKTLSETPDKIKLDAQSFALMARIMLDIDDGNRTAPIEAIDNTDKFLIETAQKKLEKLNDPNSNPREIIKSVLNDRYNGQLTGVAKDAIRREGLVADEN